MRRTDGKKNGIQQEEREKTKRRSRCSLIAQHSLRYAMTLQKCPIQRYPSLGLRVPSCTLHYVSSADTARGTLNADMGGRPCVCMVVMVEDGDMVMARVHVWWWWWYNLFWTFSMSLCSGVCVPECVLLCIDHGEECPLFFRSVRGMRPLVVREEPILGKKIPVITGQVKPIRTTVEQPYSSEATLTTTSWSTRGREGLSQELPRLRCLKVQACRPTPLWGSLGHLSHLCLGVLKGSQNLLESTTYTVI